ncbi:MAG: hypothetical protein V1899_02215 [Planctomycetota bacterium]
MKYLINAQFGRILLALAVLLTGLNVYYNGTQNLLPVDDRLLARPVMVPLDKVALTMAGSEVYFMSGPILVSRYVFEEPRKVRIFTPVDIDIPPASVMRPPQVLPDPGPALDSTDKLPRWGEEFPPLILIPSTDTNKTPTVDPKKTPTVDPKKTPPKLP